jgi:serine/threonine protein kinase
MLVGKPGTQGTEEAPVLKVIDFGLAKVVSELHEDRGATDTRILFVGTPAFASPEQYSKLEDARIDTRSDIYSLGVTLWYLLCGKMPLSAVAWMSWRKNSGIARCRSINLLAHMCRVGSSDS